MAARAVRCFREQTYDPARRILAVLDTGAADSFRLSASDCENEYRVFRPSVRGKSIGVLRNFAIECVAPMADIFLHWDDDDYSHPSRIAEQVAFLQSSGADAVGYGEMIFWDSRVGSQGCSCCGTTPCSVHPVGEGGEAWIYRGQNPSYCLGTSLAYWRKTWERKPFPDLMTAEDLVWQTGLKMQAVSSIQASVDYVASTRIGAPRMIASIHSGNTGSEIKPREREWRRAPQWDSYCAEVMKL